MKLEICLPIFNEEECLVMSIEKIFSWVESEQILNYFDEFFIHCVDNGSNDKTLKILIDLKKKYKNLFFTSFTDNYGFSSSTSYLLHESKGDFVLLIPADGQVPLDAVKTALLETLNTDSPTFLVREKSLGSSRLINKIKKVFYKILDNFSYGTIEGYFGMGVYPSSSLDIIKNFPFSPFQIRLVLPYIVDSYNLVSFKELKRVAGKTSFGLLRYFKESFNLILSSQKFPTILSLILFSFLATISIISVPTLFIAKVLFPNLIHPGFASLIILMLLLMATQALFALIVLLEIKSRDGILGLAISRRKRPRVKILR